MRTTERAAERMRPTLVGEGIRFVAVGAAATLLNALLYLALREALPALGANLVALLLSTAASTELNRRFTVHAGAAHPLRTHVQNTGTVLWYAFSSTLVLLWLGQVVTDPSAGLEAAAVASASVVGGVVRFAVLRWWVFADRADEPAPPTARRRPTPVG